MFFWSRCARIKRDARTKGMALVALWLLLCIAVDTEPHDAHGGSAGKIRHFVFEDTEPAAGYDSNERTRRDVAAALAEGRPTIPLLAVVSVEHWQRAIEAFDSLGAEIHWQDERTGLLSLSMDPGLVHQAKIQPGVEALITPGKVSTALLAAPPQQKLNPVMSMSRNRESANADQLLEQGIDGEGVVIAIVDTGIDPATTALRQTPSGSRKLIDWVDLTDEGKLQVSGSLRLEPGARSVVIEGKNYLLPQGTVSLTQRPRYSFWHENDHPLSAKLSGDVNRNGKNDEQYLVLLGDTARPGVYDTVWIDTNLNGSLNDEQALKVYKNSGTWTQMGKNGLGIVLAEVDPLGQFIKLGFDANGHGTLVAEVAAGWDPATYSEPLAGMAPGASLMAIKSVTTSGDGSWESVVRGVRYAALNGADIVNVSISGVPDMGDTSGPETEMLRRLAREYGILIVMAAGNAGPGLGSVSTPGDADWMLTVGAYHSPATSEILEGRPVPNEGVWAYSGRGPRSDGKLAVNLVAPGEAAVQLPPWMQTDGTSVQVFQGTSAAAPHAAGFAALLYQAAERLSNRPVPIQAFLRTMEQSARFLNGVSVVGQGYGLIDVAAALRRLGELYRVEGNWESGWVIPAGPENAWTDRARTVVQVSTDGPGRSVIARNLVMDPGDRVELERNPFLVQEDQFRRLQVSQQPLVDFGLHSSLLMFLDQATGQLLTGLPVTRVEPLELKQANHWSVAVSGNSSRMQLERTYVQVPEGSTQVEWRVRVTTTDRAGSIRWYLYRPGGERVYVSEWLGRDQTFQEEHIVLKAPQAGIWEIVIEARPEGESIGWAASARASGLHVQPVRLEAGSNTRSLASSFQLEAFGEPVRLRYETTGLSSATDTRHYQFLRLSEGSPAFLQLPAITGDIDQLYLAFSPFEYDTAPASGTFQIFLYRRTADGGLVEAARSKPSRWPSLTVYRPDQGSYVAWVEGSQLAFKEIQGQFEYTLGRGSDLQVASLGKSYTPRQPWRVWLQIPRLPAQSGIYHGSVLIRDEQTRHLLAVVPVEVRKGLPKLWVQPGRMDWKADLPGTLAIHIRDAATGAAVDTGVWINDRWYPVRNGMVLWPLPAGRSSVRLTVRIEDPRYEYVEKSWNLRPQR